MFPIIPLLCSHKTGYRLPGKLRGGESFAVELEPRKFDQRSIHTCVRDTVDVLENIKPKFTKRGTYTKLLKVMGYR